MQVSLLLDEQSQEQLESLRRQYYPKHLNKHEAHLTFFYKLYLKDTILLKDIITSLAVKSFEINIDAVHATPNGIQLNLSNPMPLVRLKKNIATKISKYVFRNDKRRYTPHVTIQHGVTNFKASQTAEALHTTFQPIKATVLGLVCKEIEFNKVKSKEIIHF